MFLGVQRLHPLQRISERMAGSSLEVNFNSNQFNCSGFRSAIVILNFLALLDPQIKHYQPNLTFCVPPQPQLENQCSRFCMLKLIKLQIRLLLVFTEQIIPSLTF
jgi:hypothetical protein